MPGKAVNVAITVKNKKFKINSIYFDSGMSYYNPTLSFNVGDEFEFGQKVNFTLSAASSSFTLLLLEEKQSISMMKLSIWVALAFQVQ